MTDAFTLSTFTTMPRVRLLWKVLFEESLAVAKLPWGILQNIQPILLKSVKVTKKNSRLRHGYMPKGHESVT